MLILFIIFIGLSIGFIILLLIQTRLVNRREYVKLLKFDRWVFRAGLAMFISAVATLIFILTCAL